MALLLLMLLSLLLRVAMLLVAVLCEGFGLRLGDDGIDLKAMSEVSSEDKGAKNSE